VLGKPAADFFALAARSAAVPIAGCLVVGDDASTDIAGGNAAEARTVQVRTGKYADQAGSAGLPIPSATIDSIADLPSLVGGGQEQRPGNG
jgi:ribonucleotide monophosphatase NagD (HAD superfamily)